MSNAYTLGSSGARVFFVAGDKEGGEQQRGGGAGDAAVEDYQPRRRRRPADGVVRVRWTQRTRLVRGQSAHAQLSRLVRVQPAVRLHNLARSARFGFAGTICPRSAIRTEMTSDLDIRHDAST